MPVFTFLVRERSDLFDFGTPDECESAAFVDHVTQEAREWLEERVGPSDFPFNPIAGVVKPGHWDVVHPSLAPDGHAVSVFDYLAIRMDTDDVTAVEFKLRWG